MTLVPGVTWETVIHLFPWLIEHNREFLCENLHVSIIVVIIVLIILFLSLFCFPLLLLFGFLLFLLQGAVGAALTPRPVTTILSIWHVIQPARKPLWVQAQTLMGEIVMLNMAAVGMNVQSSFSVKRANLLFSGVSTYISQTHLKDTFQVKSVILVWSTILPLLNYCWFKHDNTVLTK